MNELNNIKFGIFTHMSRVSVLCMFFYVNRDNKRWYTEKEIKERDNKRWYTEKEIKERVKKYINIPSFLMRLNDLVKTNLVETNVKDGEIYYRYKNPNQYPFSKIRASDKLLFPELPDPVEEINLELT